MPDLNFQTYIHQATALSKTVKTGAKLLKGIPLNPSTILTTVLNSYMKPVFDKMKQFRDYIPGSIPLP